MLKKTIYYGTFFNRNQINCIDIDSKKLTLLQLLLIKPGFLEIYNQHVQIIIKRLNYYVKKINKDINIAQNGSLAVIKD